MSEFVRENGVVIVCLGTLVILALYFYAQMYQGVRKRRQPIKKRTILMEDVWFADLYPLTSPEAKRTAREVLEAIANEIGVDWGQLRQEDTFEETLRIDPKYHPVDDLEKAESQIVKLATARGINEIPPPGFTGPLSGFLDQWLELNGTDSLVSEGPQLPGPAG